MRERCDVGGAFAFVDGQDREALLVEVLVGNQVLQVMQSFDTARAPGCPEIDDYHFAFELGKGDLLAVEGCKGEIGGGAAQGCRAGAGV
jgi:hypothetical protein